MKCIEAFGQHLVKSEESRRIIPLEKGIHKRETVFIIKDIEVAQHIGIFHIGTAESHGLVKYGKSVAHGTVRLVCNHMQRLIIYRHTFTGSHHTQVTHDIVHSDPVEVICLTPGKDGRKNLVLFSSGQNEYSMRRRFLECLEESIERSLREHMHLVDDINAVSSHLRRYPHLIHKVLYIIDTIV